MASYVDARHRPDLRRDIAARLLPSAGSCSPGAKVVFIGKAIISQLNKVFLLAGGSEQNVRLQEGAVCVIEN